MRRCSKCGQHKPLDDFHWRNKQKGQRNSRCKTCMREYHSEWYESHHVDHVANVRRDSKRRMADRKALVDELKSHPCTDCGQSFPSECMDFDHMPGCTKVMAISQLIRRAPSLAVLEDELAKCELVCANCHRIRTASRRRQSDKAPIF